MPGEVDPRLVGFLEATLGFVDALRDLGLRGEAAVSLDRDDGLAVLRMISGAEDAASEERSRALGRGGDGVSRIRAAGLTFSWPVEGSPARLTMSPITPQPMSLRTPANDNGHGFGTAAGWGGFEEDTPALR